jgi:putative nucleotidyltransferase with HDIG domain
MKEETTIDVRDLRVGLHVQLDLGWMSHPFPLNSFRIASSEHIAALQGLGLARVRVIASRSDPQALREAVSAGAIDAQVAGLDQAVSQEVERPSVPASAGLALTPEAALARRRREEMEREAACVRQGERLYLEAGRGLKRSYDLALSQPQAAREQCEAQVLGFLERVLGEQEMAIRLLSDGAGDRAAMHGVNVAAISLLLGKALGLAKPEMFDLGVGAMLHDVGKRMLPERVRWLDAHAGEVSVHERQFYQEHVAHGVALARSMGLSPGAQLVIAQHHEHADGSGYPLRLGSARMVRGARIVALVNRYDRLCNPNNPAQSLTPHEALSVLFAQLKAKFDEQVFGAFIRMMGIYPPGSVVQLTDDRYALVVSVNSSRALKPRVLVHDPKLRRDEAIVLNLEEEPGLGIRRSLKPQHLPRATLDCLSPRQRICYFFERARDTLAAPCEEHA